MEEVKHIGHATEDKLRIIAKHFPHPNKIRKQHSDNVPIISICNHMSLNSSAIWEIIAQPM